MARSYGRAGAAERARVRVEHEGSARSLVIDETFASYFRPGEVLTGCVWDAIGAPLAWLPPERRRRILILGLGGGSVARLARALAPRAEIVGVELDREVVRLARAELELDALGVAVHVEDALGWLERDRSRYDAILDDVFVGHGDDVSKPDWIPEPGHRLAAARLTRGGILISNTLDEHAAVARALARRFAAVAAVGTEGYDNRVLVAGSRGLTGAALRSRVAAEPVLRASLGVLSFRSRAGAVPAPV